MGKRRLVMATAMAAVIAWSASELRADPPFSHGDRGRHAGHHHHDSSYCPCCDPCCPRVHFHAYRPYVGQSYGYVGPSYPYVGGYYPYVRSPYYYSVPGLRVQVLGNGWIIRY